MNPISRAAGQWRDRRAAARGLKTAATVYGKDMQHNLYGMSPSSFYGSSTQLQNNAKAHRNDRNILMGQLGGERRSYLEKNEKEAQSAGLSQKKAQRLTQKGIAKGAKAKYREQKRVANRSFGSDTSYKSTSPAERFPDSTPTTNSPRDTGHGFTF